MIGEGGGEKRIKNEQDVKYMLSNINTMYCKHIPIKNKDNTIRCPGPSMLVYGSGGKPVACVP